MSTAYLFDSIARAYADDLYRYAYYLCGHRHTAEDLVQDTFAIAWNALDQLREPSVAKSWLITTMRRHYFRTYVKPWRSNEFQQPCSLDEDDISNLSTSAINWSSDIPDVIDMQNRLLGLPAHLRETVVLQTLFGYSLAEIAELIGVSQSAAQARLHRARIKLWGHANEAPNVVTLPARSRR
jgi:RNA polymerase sigma-70 factor (ECF subfamily)